MRDREVIQMAEDCRAEIEMLRRQIDHLAPKAHAYDNLSIVLSMIPQPAQCHGHDILWTLRKTVDELRANPLHVVEPADMSPYPDAPDFAEVEPDYNAMSPGQFVQAIGADGLKWAAAFRQKNPDCNVPEDELLAWFCNSIMAGHDHALGNPPLNGDHAAFLQGDRS